jgi:hypothetical protein
LSYCHVQTFKKIIDYQCKEDFQMICGWCKSLDLVWAWRRLLRYHAL